jgi:prephenate dehydrogenase
VVKLIELNITVVGLGLIGGSLAMALKDLKPKNLWGIDIEKSTIEAAEKKCIIHKGYTKPEIPLKHSDIVIIALYPNLTEKFVKDNIKNFKKGAIITDVAGIKENLVNNINSFIPKSLDFIGGHPMAGSENKGLSFASKDIFNDANYIITPVEKNREENIKILESIAKKIGCKNVVRITPKAHDEIIAFTSHLTHVLAVALINSDILNVETSLFIAGSFKDGTRVADINSSLWVELLTSNRKNIINKIEVFEEKIETIKNAIKENNKSIIKSEFEKASLRRKELV